MISKEELSSHLAVFDKAITSFEQGWAAYGQADNECDEGVQIGLI